MNGACMHSVLGFYTGLGTLIDRNPDTHSSYAVAAAVAVAAAAAAVRDYNEWCTHAFRCLASPQAWVRSLCASQQLISCVSTNNTLGGAQWVFPLQTRTSFRGGACVWVCGCVGVGVGVYVCVRKRESVCVFMCVCSKITAVCAGYLFTGEHTGVRVCKCTPNVFVKKLFFNVHSCSRL